MATSSASSAKIETNVVAVASEQQPNGLEDQERRTRIALLENQQAELETEIRLLKQCSKFLRWHQVLGVLLSTVLGRLICNFHFEIIKFYVKSNLTIFVHIKL